MSISLEPNKGLRLKLGRLSPIRTWHGGGNFWSHEFQLTVRSGSLANFLPRAIEDEDSVLFEYRSGGAELASTSSAIASMSEIPAKELKALRAAVDELKKKAEDPHCDRTKRQMIEGFRLPDPQKDRDLYRLVGKGGSAKLIVLWGIEREEGSALAPGAAVDLMHTPRRDDEETTAPTSKKSALVPALVLLAALAGGGWYFWQQEQKKNHPSATANLGVPSSDADRIAAFNNQSTPTPDQAIPATSPEEPSPEEGTLVVDDKGEIAGVVDSEGTIVPAEPGTKADKGGKPTTAAKPGDIVKDTQGNVTGIVDKDGKVAAATPGKVKEAEPGRPVTAPTGTVVVDSKGTVTGVVGKDGKVVSATPGTTTDKSGKVTVSKPGTVFRDEKGTVTGVAAKDGKVVTTKPGAVTNRPATSGSYTGTYKRSTTANPIASSTPSKGTPPASGKPTPGAGTTPTAATSTLNRSGTTTSAPSTGPTSGTFNRTGPAAATPTTGTSSGLTTGAPSTGTTTGTFNRTGTAATIPTTGTSSGTFNRTVTSSSTAVPATAAGASSDSTAPAAASIATPMTTKGPPPAGISAMTIVSTSLSPVLSNGNVEVLLNVVARDASGAVVTAPPISGWKVDEVLQSKPDGSPADGPVLPVSLAPGAHRISTVGKGADGQPFQTDAEVVVTPKS